MSESEITIKSIVLEYLKVHGYDGLYCEECSCTVDDLFPCSQSDPDCKPGYDCPCPPDCGCGERHIGAKKGESDDKISG